MARHKERVIACRYAWECQTQEGGWGLDSCLREHAWKLRGIVNGIDYSEWSPGGDPHLRSDGYRNYGEHDLGHGKAECKRALQRVRICGSFDVPSLFNLLPSEGYRTHAEHGRQGRVQARPAAAGLLLCLTEGVLLG